ncbi:MAG: Hsp70 family protein [Haliangiales bacterium]
MQNQPSARFLIGIDLGTTNTAVAYVDTRSAEQRVQVFEVPQLVAAGETQPRRQLPSFVYLAGDHDLGPAETALPWADGGAPTSIASQRKAHATDDAREVVGELARSQGARVPARMIASAKSWLCHGGVDRQAYILPWGDSVHPSEDGSGDDNDGGKAGGPKRSPVEASAAVLAHIRQAWDHAHLGDREARFADQEIMVTVPASFDEAARELTLEAASRAGYPDVVLLEEPQAAFYAWIDAHPASGRARAIQPGDHVLVFDIGGGTTDFTLIEVGGDDRDSGDSGDSGDSFSRTAVGDHVLLGGDNIDLTLAKQVEARLTRGKKRKLDPVQWHGLVHACRLAKETLLRDASGDGDASGSASGVTEVPITIAGRGSKLIGGAMKDRITHDELTATLFDGFFPLVERDAAPKRARGGLHEFGLPYAADPAVTRHLAGFLARHPVARVDAVLFNGGAMTPPGVRARVLEQIARWQPDAGAPRELSNALPELAVAKGAAYYGLVRRGFGARIRGGTARAFYIGVGRVDHRSDNSSDGGADGSAASGQPASRHSDMAVCLAPKGLDDGARVELERDFSLLTNRPVSFKLFSSSSRDDRPGALVPIGDGLAETVDDGSDLLELPPIVTALRARGRSQVTVRLEVRITELGALEIWCRDAAPDSAERWRLSFDMRAGGASADDDSDGQAGDARASEDGRAGGGALDPALQAKLAEAKQLIRDTFTGTSGDLPAINKRLEGLLESRRDEWSMTVSRALFDATLEVEETRARSADHEQRWLNLAGFCLRPGTGAPLDQWRAKQMWRIFNQELSHPKNEACRLAWWIVWRRIAGGLTKGQQEQIYDRLAQLFLPGQKQKKKWHQVKPTRQEAAEMIRTLANLERIDPDSKIKLGDELLRRIESESGTKKAQDVPLYYWALGRIGARIPLYGPLNAVVSAQRVSGWLAALFALDWPAKATFPMAQLGRRTGDRSRDLADDVRARLAERLRTSDGGERLVRLVEEVVALEAREERVALGDTLPAGLRLIIDDERPDEDATDAAETQA